MKYSIVIRNKFNPSDYFSADFLTAEEVIEIINERRPGYIIRVRDLENFKDVTKKFLK